MIIQDMPIDYSEDDLIYTEQQPNQQGAIMKTLLILTFSIACVLGLCLTAGYANKPTDIAIVAPQTTVKPSLNDALKNEFCKDMGKGIYANARLIDANNNNACN